MHQLENKKRSLALQSPADPGHLSNAGTLILNTQYKCASMLFSSPVLNKCYVAF